MYSSWTQSSISALTEWLRPENNLSNISERNFRRPHGTLRQNCDFFLVDELLPTTFRYRLGKRSHRFRQRVFSRLDGLPKPACWMGRHRNFYKHRLSLSIKLVDAVSHLWKTVLKRDSSSCLLLLSHFFLTTTVWQKTLTPCLFAKCWNCEPTTKRQQYG